MKAYYRLKSLLTNLPGMKVSHTIDLFDKLVLPILNYGAEVWGYNIATKIERVHLLFCKQLLGVKTQTQNSLVYGELGRMPLRQLRLVKIIKYWFKILQSEDKKYIKHTYIVMLHDMEIIPNRMSWASYVKNILETYGFSEVWLYQGVANISYFINIFKQRIKDCYVQNWHMEINNSTKASTYIFFAEFSFKMYLDTVSIQKYRIAMTRLRVSSHRLEVETGRWHKPNPVPVNERKCKYCHKLEDEFHFVLECPLYTELRNTYIRPFFWTNTNSIKFRELFTSTNKVK